ncbi:hypothetical protein SynBIOSU31_01819 [Synechococcus sp. BIOS-U3-1]|nr:hypothetical protein SynBIOSU31_01819 [Synechococcus sp. BIOS-U3-1]
MGDAPQVHADAAEKASVKRLLSTVSCSWLPTCFAPLKAESIRTGCAFSQTPCLQ